LFQFSSRLPAPSLSIGNERGVVASHRQLHQALPFIFEQEPLRMMLGGITLKLLHNIQNYGVNL
jgi:hypothetical protein